MKRNGKKNKHSRVEDVNMKRNFRSPFKYKALQMKKKGYRVRMEAVKKRRKRKNEIFVHIIRNKKKKNVTYGVT